MIIRNRKEKPDILRLYSYYYYYYCRSTRIIFRPSGPVSTIIINHTHQLYIILLFYKNTSEHNIVRIRRAYNNNAIICVCVCVVLITFLLIVVARRTTDAETTAKADVPRVSRRRARPLLFYIVYACPAWARDTAAA